MHNERKKLNSKEIEEKYVNFIVQDDSDEDNKFPPSNIHLNSNRKNDQFEYNKTIENHFHQPSYPQHDLGQREKGFSGNSMPPHEF